MSKMLANMRTWWEPSHIPDAVKDQQAACVSKTVTSAGGWGASVYSLGRRATAVMATAVAAAASVSGAGAGGSGAAAIEKVPPPWSGLAAGAREQVLALGRPEGRDLLLRGPPSTGSCPSFRFNLDAALSVASAALEADEGLRRLRFELVPRLLSEEHFWRNYFYRVYIIKRSAQISALATVAKQPEPLQQQQQQQQQQEDSGLVRSSLLVSYSKHVAATVSLSPISSSSSCDSFERVDEASSIENVEDDFDDVGIDAEWERELQLELAGIEFATSSAHASSNHQNGGGAN